MDASAAIFGDVVQFGVFFLGQAAEQGESLDGVEVEAFHHLR